MTAFKVGYAISGEDGGKEDVGGQLSLGVVSDGSTKWQAWTTVGPDTLKALGSEAALAGFAALAPGDQATVRAALADAAGSGGGAPPAAPAEEAKAEPEPAAPAAAEPAPEAPPAAPVVPAPAPAPAPVAVAPVPMQAPVPAPVPVVPAPVPVAAPPVPMPVPAPAPVPVAPPPMAHQPQLQPQPQAPPQPMAPGGGAPGAGLGGIPVAYQQMMMGGGNIMAYQQMLQQQQMQQALMQQAQLKRAAPPGLPGQYGVGAPVQKKRRSKRDESDEDDAPLTDSDEEGGQWRQPLGRMEPEQPVRRSSRRAAAEGVKRLTQALHGPSEYDEDE